MEKKMGDVSLCDLIHAMKQLTSSENQKQQPGEGAPSLDLLLQRNLETFNKALEVEPEFKEIAKVWNEVSVCDEHVNSSVRWTFTCHCLKLIHIVVQCLKNPKIDVCKDTKLAKPESVNSISQKEVEGAESKERESKVKVDEGEKQTEITLGVQDQKVVRTLLQFVVCLGVCPCLQTGVGIPLQMRSGFSLFVEHNSEGSYTNQYCLYTCLKVLLQCTEVPAVSTLVLSQHLTDILAGLLQIMHSKQNESGINDNVVLNERKKQSVKISGHRNNETVSGTYLVEQDHSRNGTVSETDLAEQDHSRNGTVSETDLAEQDHSRNGSDTTNSNNSESDRTIKDESVTTKYNDSNIDRTTQTEKLSDSTNLLAAEVEYCERALQDLYSRVYPPLLVKTLLLLQGGPKIKKLPSSKFPVLPPAPTWLRRIISQQLARIAMKPKGVQYVLRGMLDGPGATAGLSDWRRCDAVTKVIACCPLQTVTLRDYYKAIGPQIIDLLHLEDKQFSRQYLRIACSTIFNMAQQDITLTRQFVVNSLMRPFLACLADKELPDKFIIVSESDISFCIEDCHKVFVCGSTESQKLILELQPVIFTLFELLVFVKSGVLSLKKPCHELVVCYLRHSDTDVGLACLELMTFQQSQQEENLKVSRMHPGMSFQHGPNGGVHVTVASETKEDESDSTRVDCIIAILKDLGKTELAGTFFVHLLKELTQVIQTEVETFNPVEHQKARDGNLLGGENYTSAEQLYRRITLLNILACLCEELGPDCIQNATHALQFVKATLERGVQVCKNTSDPITEVFESETLSMAMGLLTATLTGAYQLTDANREFMNNLLPLLQEISNNHPESSVQEMATDIRIAIATHGAVWSETTKTTSIEFSRVSNKISQETKSAVKEKLKQNKPKIEVVKEKNINTKDGDSKVGSKAEIDHSITSSSDKVKKDGLNVKMTKETLDFKKIDSDIGSTGRNRPDIASNIPSESKRELTDKTFTDIDNKSRLSHDNEKDADQQTVKTKAADTSNKPTSNSELSQAYEELCDPLLPVRGHGLIRLTRMVQRHDSEILQRQSAILTIFLENLDHSDSYLYLAAVSGLAALSDLSPDLVVPKLCEQFANFDQLGKTGGTKRKVELRMKIGEVLVKASRCLGDTIPKYRDVLIRSFLVGTKDCEPFVRASSLSNLGEICKLLKFSLGNCIHEVFECCSSLLRYDTDLEVRKAAGQAITLLLQGMNGDSFKVLEDVIKDLYRALKQSMLSEKEDGVKVHVTLALNELDDIMRNKLFPTQKLEKRIRVLDFD